MMEKLMKSKFEPSIYLHQLVKAGFVAKGTSLSAWCLEQGIHCSNAKQCLTGNWNGPKAKLLRSKLIKESGIEIDDGSTGFAGQKLEG